jgi:hypothetical protein
MVRTAGLLVVLSACAGCPSPAPGSAARDARVGAPAITRHLVGPRTLLGLESGDHGCDVLVRDDDGEEERRDGMHVLCADAAGLIGRRVLLTVEQRPEIAPVVAITAAP